MLGGRGGNMGFPVGNFAFPGGMRGRQFGRMAPIDGQRTSPNNPSRMGQGGQYNSPLNRMSANIPAGQVLVIGNVILTGVLMLVLIAAIIFASRYKKSYKV